MKRILFSSFLMVIFTLGTSAQEKELTHLEIHKRGYTNIKSYRKIFGDSLNKQDSLHFKFKNNDTLVLLPKGYLQEFNNERVTVKYEPKDSLFLETYKDLVYLKYHSNKHQFKNRTMHYWKDEIKIYFANSVDKKIKTELKSFAISLDKEIDSLKISFVKKIEDSNYIIYAVENENDFQYNANIKKNAIDYYCNWNGKQQLYKTELQLYPSKFKEIKYQITESKLHFFRSLGFFTPSKRIPKDSFLSAYSSSNKRMLDQDLEFLKYHYSYGICKGTKLDRFEAQHKKAKKMLKEENTYLHFAHKD